MARQGGRHVCAMGHEPSYFAAALQTIVELPRTINKRGGVQACPRAAVSFSSAGENGRLRQRHQGPGSWKPGASSGSIRDHSVVGVRSKPKWKSAINKPFLPGRHFSPLGATYCQRASGGRPRPFWAEELATTVLGDPFFIDYSGGGSSRGQAPE
jgi:hypothetical protein